MGATREEKAATEKTINSDEFTSPSSTGPSAAPLPGPVTGPAGGDPAAALPPAEAMIRRTDGGVLGGGFDASSSDPVARDRIASREDGILSAPSGPERLGDPDYLLNCNVHLLRVDPTARWRNTAEFLAWLRTATTVPSDLLMLMQGDCDIQAFVEEGTARSGQTTEGTVVGWYAHWYTAHPDYPRFMGPGRYLIFRSVADMFPHPEDFVGNRRNFGDAEELREFALDPAKVKFLGEFFVSPMAPMLNGIDRNDLFPSPLPSSVRGHLPELGPTLLDGISP